MARSNKSSFWPWLGLAAVVLLADMLTKFWILKNYQLGVLFRRQVYRNYLFLEVEPAYNYRKENEDAKRQFGWSIALRLQVALERDLTRKKNRNKDKNPEVEALGPADGHDLPGESEGGDPSAAAPRSTAEDL